MTDTTSRRGWLGLLSTVFTALLVVVGADLLLGRIVPPTVQTEVYDAVDHYRGSDPTVLVLGSSHARTFDVVDEELRTRTGGLERILAVPVEWGKMTTYRFVLDERLRPFVEEKRGGEPRRPSLRRFILVTEWWDSTPPDDGTRATNVPARAWGIKHFVAHVARNGMDDYNRNFLNAHWRRLFRHSSLVQDHGHDRIMPALIRLVRSGSPSGHVKRYEERVASWQRMLEGGDERMLEHEQMQAFEEILDIALGWDLEVTVLLYPRMPATITETAERTTLARFADEIERRTDARGVRLVDFTTRTPLTDEHFAADFDHVTPDGNAMFAKWALDGELSFLLERSKEQPAEPGVAEVVP